MALENRRSKKKTNSITVLTKIIIKVTDYIEYNWPNLTKLDKIDQITKLGWQWKNLISYFLSQTLPTLESVQQCFNIDREQQWCNSILISSKIVITIPSDLFICKLLSNDCWRQSDLWRMNLNRFRIHYNYYSGVLVFFYPHYILNRLYNQTAFMKLC